MTAAWITLIMAGLLEVVGVIGIKRVAEKNNVLNNVIMIAGFIISFQLLVQTTEVVISL